MKNPCNAGGAGWLVAVTMAMAAGSAGCQQLEKFAWRGDSGPSRAEPTEAVTRAQEADMQIVLGRAAEHRGDLDQAMMAYKEALKRDKKRADAYERLGIIHDQKGDFQQSAEYYRMALESNPGNPDVYCDMGYSLYLQRRWAEAERNLKQAIVLRPDHARAHNNLGLVLARGGRSEDALAEFRKAGNDEARARGNLALAMTLDGRWDEARVEYRKVLAAEPASEMAQARLRELDAVATRLAARPAAVRDEQVIATAAPGPAPRPVPAAPAQGRPAAPKTVLNLPRPASSPER